jgi:WD40 repeat protein
MSLFSGCDQKCLSDLFNQDEYESIDGTLSLVCDANNKNQVRACSLVCRSNYSLHYQCAYKMDIPVCLCSNKQFEPMAPEPAWTGDLFGHLDVVNSFVVLGNGYLVSASDDSTIKIWNPHDGSLVETLNQHAGQVKSLDLLPNSFLISGSSDYTIRVWNTKNFDLLQTFRAHQMEAYSMVALSSNLIAVGDGSSQGKIAICNLNNNNVDRFIKAYSSGMVRCLAVLNNGWLASGSFENGLIKLWNPYDGHLMKTLMGHSGIVFSLLVLRNGHLVSSSSDATIKIWEPASGRLIQNLNESVSSMFSLAMLDNGNLASVGSEKDVFFWDLNTGKLIKNIQIADNYLLGYSIVALKKNTLAVSNPDGFGPIRIVKY